MMGKYASMWFGGRLPDGIFDCQSRYVETGVLVITLTFKEIEMFDTLVQALKIKYEGQSLVILDVAGVGRHRNTVGFDKGIGLTPVARRQLRFWVERDTTGTKITAIATVGVFGKRHVDDCIAGRQPDVGNPNIGIL